MEMSATEIQEVDGGVVWSLVGNLLWSMFGEGCAQWI